MVNQIHALILTLDEGQHIARCIGRIKEQCASITLIDSGSRDETVEIARSLGAEVMVNSFVTHAGQVNFAIETLASRGGWLLRIDADEILDRDSSETLSEVGAEVDGLLVQRRIHFLGKRIRYGAIEPSWQLRIWRNGSGRCQQRWMDEHIQVVGRIVNSGVVLSDKNLNSITWWTSKHNSYGSREAVEILNLRHRLFQPGTESRGQTSPQARRRLISSRSMLRARRSSCYPAPRPCCAISVRLSISKSQTAMSARSRCCCARPIIDYLHRRISKPRSKPAFLIPLRSPTAETAIHYVAS